jgi:hypothetical protein
LKLRQFLLLGESVSKIGVSEATVSVLEIAAGVILLLTGAGAPIGIGVIGLGVLGLVSAFSGDTDNLASTVQQLVADFNVLFDELQAEADVLLMRSVEDKIALARTALNTLRMFPDNPDLKNPNLALVLSNSSLAVEALAPAFPCARMVEVYPRKCLPKPLTFLADRPIVRGLGRSVEPPFDGAHLEGPPISNPTEKAVQAGIHGTQTEGASAVVILPAGDTVIAKLK